MDSLNDYDPPTEPPTFYEVLAAAQDAGLVGESDTLLTVVLAMLRGGLIVMTGPARAGKDEVVDAAESVFDADRTVYRWPVDDSETAAYYNRHEINQYPIHRFPDLARLEQHHEKILKAFGEGRDAERNRTDIAAQEGQEVEDQVLTCPKTVIAFIASDNENVNLDDYPELRNRALVLSVDASAEQTNSVNERKALEHADKDQTRVDPIRRARIQSYHSSIPVDEWTDSPTNKIVNPMALEIHDQQPIPELFPEARQDFDRLLGFMGTVTLYHYAERIVFEDGGRRMLVTPKDVWEAMTIIGNRMVMSSLNLTKEDRAILDLLDESRSNLTKADIQQRLREHGYHVTDRDVRRSLGSMRMKGYVREHQGNPNNYSFNDFANVVYSDAGLDYPAIVDAASEGVYDVAPDSVADKYAEQFCAGEGLIATHPFTGEAVDIRNTDELEDMLETGIESIQDHFGVEESDTAENETEKGQENQQKLI